MLVGENKNIKEAILSCGDDGVLGLRLAMAHEASTASCAAAAGPGTSQSSPWLRYLLLLLHTVLQSRG